MKSRFLIGVAAAALIGSAGLVSAQTPGNAPNAPAASQGAGGAGERSAPMDRGGDNGMKAQMPREGGAAQRAQDNARDDMKTKGAETTRDPKGGKAASDTNMERSKDGMKADQKNAADRDRIKSDQKNASDQAGTTTGQAGAGAKLSTEQRTTIRTSITKQNIKPATNINFSISVGTRVPRTVGFHPLPAEVITVYPDWRGYEFFLVNDEIVVVNPRTLEIVAVIDA